MNDYFKKKLNCPLTIGIVLFVCFSLHAGNEGSLTEKGKELVKTRGPGKINELKFTENKGQMADLRGTAVPGLLFKTSLGGVDLYICTSGLSYVFKKPDREGDSLHYTYCRADMELTGAAVTKENCLKEFTSAHQTDYYQPQCPEGVLHVHSYEKLTFSNVYPGIDWVLYDTGGKLKYDFIVHPGGDPSQIRLNYKWTDRPVLRKDGSMTINTPVGSLEEGAPVSFQKESSFVAGNSPGRANSIETHFVLRGSEAGFSIGSYDKSRDLRIDPTLVWATYYAGTSDLDDVQSIMDDKTSLWVTGTTTSLGFPTQATGGQYFQGTNAGSWDAFVMQFSLAGALKWSTYFGGSKWDQANSIQSDGTNVWVTGYTNSSDFPVKNPGTGNYMQLTNATPFSSFNAFILQFTVSDVLVWSTYFGGASTTSGDKGNSIQSDGTNVWVTGICTSTNFPTQTKAGSYFNGAISGNEDAFVSEFTTAGKLVWSTYLGPGSGTSIFSDLSNVWVTGYAGSGFPLKNPGGGAFYQSVSKTFNNTGFVTQFSNAGVLTWSTFYGGSGEEEGTCIQSDGKHVWLTGGTASSDFPTLDPGGATYFQGSNNNYSAGGSNVFIAEFTTAGVQVWSTYYGGSGGQNTSHISDEGYSIQSDGSNVWICGSTVSTDFPLKSQSCGGWNQTAFGAGTVDVFILQFCTTGVLQWATYYGTDGEFDGSAVSADSKNLFVGGDAGGVAGTAYPLQNPGAPAYYHPTMDGGPGGENVFVGQFNISCSCASPTFSMSVSPADTTLCSSGSVTLTASGGSGCYSWSPGGATTSFITVSPGSTSTYTVTATAPGGCTGSATAVVTISQGPVINSVTPTNPGCSGGTGSAFATASGGTGTLTYSWGPAVGSGQGTATVSGLADGTYSLTVTDGAGCQAVSTISIVAPAALTLSATQNVAAECGKNNGVAIATAGGGTGTSYTYDWSSGASGITGSGSGFSASTLAAGIYTVTVADVNGCTTTASVTIGTSGGPSVTLNRQANVCPGDSDGVLSVSVAGGLPDYTYSWSTGMSSSSAAAEDSVLALKAGSYTLTVTDANGCTGTLTETVSNLPGLVPSISRDTAIFKGSRVQLVAGGGSMYLWTPPDSLSGSGIANPVADPSQTTYYKVIVSDANGCSGLDSVLVTVVESTDCDSLNALNAIFVPSAFSPNADGQNDVFYVRIGYLSCLANMKIEVFDRWGELVFSTSNPDVGWDGKFKGQLMNQAVFFYYLTAASTSGQTIERKGNITLVR